MKLRHALLQFWVRRTLPDFLEIGTQKRFVCGFDSALENSTPEVNRVNCIACRNSSIFKNFESATLELKNRYGNARWSSGTLRPVVIPSCYLNFICKNNYNIELHQVNDIIRIIRNFSIYHLNFYAYIIDKEYYIIHAEMNSFHYDDKNSQIEILKEFKNEIPIFRHGMEPSNFITREKILELPSRINTLGFRFDTEAYFLNSEDTRAPVNGAPVNLKLLISGQL